MFKQIITLITLLSSTLVYASDGRPVIDIQVMSDTRQVESQGNTIGQCLEKELTSRGNRVVSFEYHDYRLEIFLVPMKKRLIGIKTGINVVAVLNQRYDSDLHSYLYDKKFREIHKLTTGNLYYRRAMISSMVGMDFELSQFCREIADYVALAMKNPDTYQMKPELRKELEKIKANKLQLESGN